MIQRIKSQQVRANAKVNAAKSNNKVSVLAAYMPRIDRAAKRQGVNASALGKEKMFVMAQAMANVEKLLKKQGINIGKPVSAGMLNSVGTETGGLAGHAARFISLITADILVNLTAYDHVVVFPMKARTSLFVYPKYTYGTNKGEYRQGELIRDVFESSRQSSTYVGSIVTREAYEIAKSSQEITFEPEAPNPVVGTMTIECGTAKAVQKADGTWTQPAGSEFTVAQDGAEITVTLAAQATSVTPVLVTYAYDNEKIPRHMVPTINVELATIQLYAKFYQIQIAYDLFADFESDNDYGFSISGQLPEQAALEVKAEIDRLVYDKLEETAVGVTTEDEQEKLTVDFSFGDETRDFTDIIKRRLGKLIARFNQLFIKRTGRSQGLKNLIFAPEALDFLTAVVENAADSPDAFGPYKMGTFSNVGIYIDPYLATDTEAGAGKIACPVIGVAKSRDGKRAPLVLGEYMPLVPTNKLELPDFTAMQGWATACAVEVLNDILCGYAEITLGA